MRRRLKSLSLTARMLLISLVTSALILLFAGLSIGSVLEHFVAHGLDQFLDTQIGSLDRAVAANGNLDATRVVELPAFAGREPGWTWQVASPAGRWSSGSSPVVEIWSHDHHPHRQAIWTGVGVDAAGDRLHVRQTIRRLPAGTLTISATAPEQLVEQPLRQVEGTLLLSLALLACALAVATWAQLRLGLRPVLDLKRAVARVRSGMATTIPADQPAELRPLADEVNALVKQNHAGLEHARAHVANLAHGLKTPLATLSLKLSGEGASSDALALVAELDARIAHHLRRARTAAPSAGTRARTDVAEVIGDLTSALQQIHSDRKLSVNTMIEPQLCVAVERHDLEELLGNLLDNACRHARAVVVVNANGERGSVYIRICDDGPGMADEEISRAMQAGVRLDETEPGYGFGLSIAVELTQLYGGTLALERSTSLGGLEVAISLPRSARPA